MTIGTEEAPEELAQRTVSRLFRKAEKPEQPEEPKTPCEELNVESPWRLRRSSRVAARMEREANAYSQADSSHSPKNACRRRGKIQRTASNLGYFELLPVEVGSLTSCLLCWNVAMHWLHVGRTDMLFAGISKTPQPGLKHILT